MSGSSSMSTKMNRCSQEDCSQEDNRILRYNHVLEGINCIFSNVVQAKTEEELGEACLSVALGVTGSQFGFVIEIGADGLLHDVAKSKLAWEQCLIYDKTGHLSLPRDYVVHGLYGSVIINGKSFFTNDPQSHPDSRGLPQGHPPITSFLSVPLILDGKIVGSIAVANREGGYSNEQKEDLESIAPAVAQVLKRMKVEQERKDLEEQTRQRAEEIETLMDILPVAIFIGHDPKCLNITGNRLANELYESKIGENVSANVSQTRRLFRKDIELSANELPMQKAAAKDVEVRNEELDVLLPSGEWRGFLGSASPLHDAAGKVRGSVGAFIDITERKNAEARLKETLHNLEKLIRARTSELEKAYNSLKESERGLAEAQEMAHIGNWEWDITADKAYWSEEMYRIFKRDPQKLAPSLDEYLSYIHPDDLDYYCKVNDYTRKLPTPGLDFRIVLANGEERKLHIQSDFILNNENIPIRVKGIVQDITESKKAEEQIKESEEKYRNIVETANEGIALINSEGVITFVNKKMADMLGYAIEETVGRTIWDFIEEKQKSAVTAHFEGRSPYSVPDNFEFELIRKDGSHFWVLINAKAIFDKDGKFIGSLNLHTDITERKKTEETIRNFETAQKKEIHHRIKNNLQVISSLLDLQADLFKGRENIKDSEVLRAFKNSIDRVLSISLIHEELYKGKNIDQLNFSQYVKELAENLILTYKLETDISFNLDLQDQIFIDMDTAIPLGIIINELITNSFKYAFFGRDKGEIGIRLHREGSGKWDKEADKSTTFVLSVSDNGIGISKDLNIEDLDSLGLQLVTTLISQLDGVLELKREHGTEFIIRLTVP